MPDSLDGYLKGSERTASYNSFQAEPGGVNDAVQEEVALSIRAMPSFLAEPTEMCEHKGIGHPDSICDGAVEAASLALCRAYLEAYGVVQHFNLDKALLVGGISAPRFGGGRCLQPVRLIVSGPVTELPSAKTEPIVAEAIHQYLNTCIGEDAGLIHVEPILRPSAPALRRVIGKRRLPLSNDTSFGVGYAPFSELESMVLSASSLLRGSHFHDAFLSAGFDQLPRRTYHAGMRGCHQYFGRS